MGILLGERKWCLELFGVSRLFFGPTDFFGGLFKLCDAFFSLKRKTIHGVTLIRKMFMGVLICAGKIIANFLESFALHEHFYKLSDYCFVFRLMGYWIMHERFSN